MRTPAWLARIEARLQLALSRATAAVISASSGVKALAILANHQEATNAAPIAPAGSFQWSSNAFTTTTGKVRVVCIFTVSQNGGTFVALDSATLSAIRDGAGPAGPTNTVGIAANTAQAQGGVPVTLAFDDVVTAGSTHTWGGQVTIDNGHTAGVAAAGQVTVLIQEQA